jgi:hypothetical protein
MATTEEEEWPVGRVQQQFKDEVQKVFEAENAAGRAEEAAQIEELLKEKPELATEEWLAVRDSFYWRIYEDCTFEFYQNSVDIICPVGYAIRSEFIEMFGGTSVGWSIPTVGAKIVNGEPRVVIDVLLIDFWSDTRAAAWVAGIELRREKRISKPTVASQMGLTR